MEFLLKTFFSFLIGGVHALVTHSRNFLLDPITPRNWWVCSRVLGEIIYLGVKDF
jgi:hypothetical protein